MHFALALIDTAVMAAAYAAAFMMRFDFREPPWGWPAVAASFATVWLVQMLVLWATGCLRRWRFTAIDIPRYALCFTVSGGILLILRVLMPDAALLYIRPPYTVAFLNTFFAATGLVAVRYAFGRYAAAKAGEAAALLPRPAALADTEDVVAMLSGKTVLVTGAGGSIGSEIVRQCAILGARRVVMAERGERELYEIDRAMRAAGTSAECIPELADVANPARTEALFAKYKPQIVIHAAAYKHVPMAELHPAEVLRNNTLATRMLGETALRHGTERFVMISTDKAVNPVSVMGITKRLAEILLMDLAEYVIQQDLQNPGKNRQNGAHSVNFASDSVNPVESGSPAHTLSCVRFGNVLGSSGSVVPLFEEQIAAGGPVTVTHPDMRRYFMTVQEAVGLVLKAAAQRKNAIFTLDMGESVKITDLAEQMIRRKGLVPGKDVKIVFTGIRPGEKLFEELDVSEKSAFRTGHARIFTCRGQDVPREKAQQILAAVQTIAASPETTRPAIEQLLR